MWCVSARVRHIFHYISITFECTARSFDNLPIVKIAVVSKLTIKGISTIPLSELINSRYFLIEQRLVLDIVPNGLIYFARVLEIFLEYFWGFHHSSNTICRYLASQGDSYIPQGSSWWGLKNPLSASVVSLWTFSTVPFMENSPSIVTSIIFAFPKCVSYEPHPGTKDI